MAASTVSLLQRRSSAVFRGDAASSVVSLLSRVASSVRPRAALKPTVTSITPANGPESTATAVVVGGTDFVNGPGLAVTINGIACTSVVWVSTIAVTCLTPASIVAGGPYDVRLTNPDGQFGTLVGGYTFDPPSAWAPPDASVGTKLWYRPDLGLTEAGGLVSGLADQSGLADAGRDQAAAGADRPGYLASDATYGNQPVLTFDGTQSMLSGVFNAAVAPPLTLLIIGQIDVDSAMLSNGVDSNMVFKSAGNAYFYGAAQGSAPFGAATVTAPCCIMYTDDGTGAVDAAKIYVNDLTNPIGTGSTNWASTTGLHLGLDVVAVGKLQGKVAEAILWGGVLAADLPDAINYLNVTRAYGIGVV